jgi:tRNA-specific 2-thiouridylase
MVNKKKVMIGLSGGVDSAVAAYLLLEQGYELIAGFMKNYADEENPDCHTREDRNMAIKVAQHLGISTFVIFDFRQQYDDAIVQYIYEGYKQGITPNPDVLCNSLIKFRLFLDKAKQL